MKGFFPSWTDATRLPKYPFCVKFASQILQLKIHVIEHFKKRWKEPFACSLCDKKFMEHFQAKQHEMLHTGEKPYACNVCEEKKSDKRPL